MLMYGTTMFMVEVVAKPRPHPGLWSTAGVFRDTIAWLLAWPPRARLRPGSGISPGIRLIETLVQEAGTGEAGSEGLVMLPYFAGERTPIFDPDARGVICGLTLSHGRGHLYRAALEATATACGTSSKPCVKPAEAARAS